MDSSCLHHADMRPQSAQLLFFPVTRTHASATAATDTNLRQPWRGRWLQRSPQPAGITHEGEEHIVRELHAAAEEPLTGRQRSRRDTHPVSPHPNAEQQLTLSHAAAHSPLVPEAHLSSASLMAVSTAALSCEPGKQQTENQARSR